MLVTEIYIYIYILVRTCVFNEKKRRLFAANEPNASTLSIDFHSLDAIIYGSGFKLLNCYCFFNYINFHVTGSQLRQYNQQQTH